MTPGANRLAVQVGPLDGGGGGGGGGGAALQADCPAPVAAFTALPDSQVGGAVPSGECARGGRPP
jgi:hypothetical protein